MPVEPVHFGTARVIWSKAEHGHLSHNPSGVPHDERCCGDEAVARRAAVRPGVWARVEQVHGGDVVRVSSIHDHLEVPADALVTDLIDVPLAIGTADCGPVALQSPEGIVGAVHAGWRGLANGAIENAVAEMRSMGATSVEAMLGPCIRSECNEFGEAELADFVERWGPSVRSTTQWGTPSFDMVAAVEQICSSIDVKLAGVDDACTACTTEYFSHRARKDKGRQVMLVWSTGRAA